MPSEEANEAFRAFINELIETFANAVFEQSQAVVPVKTGALKESGTITKSVFGMKIEYDTPYASLIDGHGQDTTMIYKDGNSYRFPKSPATTSGFVSNTVEELAEVMLPQLIIESNGGEASINYNFYIQ